MLFQRTIRSVAEMLRAVEPRQRSSSIPIWYRGDTNKRHKLVPSLARPPYGLQHEQALINAFKQNAVQFVTSERPTSQWEWLFLARHHYVPTRLLDWTESPLMGLYFAVTPTEDQPRKDDNLDGVLWSLLPTELNRRANISYQEERELPIFEDKDEYLGNYLPSTLARERTSRMTPIAGIAVRHSKRMQAQYSVFTVTHREQTPIEIVGDGTHIGRYIIPSNAKPRIHRDLEALRINRLSVFPGLDNVARLARRPYDQ